MKTNKATKILFIVFTSIFAAMLIAGICVLAICGFNKSAEIQGGEKITITATNAGLLDDETYNTQFQQKQGKIISAAKSVLLKHGKVNVTAEIKGEGHDQTIVLIYKDKDEHRDDIAVENAQIVQEIRDSVFLVSEIGLTVSDAKKVGPSTYVNWGVESIGICALILLVFTYFMIRFSTNGAVAQLIGMLIFGFGLLATFAFARIEITKFLACALAVGISLIAISGIFVQNKMKKLFVSGKLEGEDAFSLIPNAVKSNLYLIVGIGMFVLLLGSIFCLINLTFGLYLIISAILATLVNLFIVPGFMVFFAGKNGFKMKFNNFNK